MGGKTRNIAIQLVLLQCYKTSCTFFVARFSVPLGDVRQDDLQRRFLGQHSVATLLRRCFECYNIVPTLQRCVALKIVVANHRTIKGDVTQEDLQRRFSMQHSVVTLLRNCFEWLQHC